MSENQSTISVNEYLKEQRLISQTAQQVAEAAGDKIECCTFNEGYVTQSLFICFTCTLKEGKMAAFCFGCSMNCHLGHEVHELWTKRNFRCDCGNENYVDFNCTLCPKQNTKNEKNKYSQNFKGLYCYCKKPYEAEEDGDMHQCTRCEDWFHHSCIEYPEPAPENMQHLLCQPCARECSALMPYRLRVPEIEQKVENSIKKRKREENASDKEHVSKKRKLNNESCSLKQIDENELKEVLDLKAIFFPLNWTESLCTCNNCKKMYKEMKMEHIFEDDPVDINGIEIDQSKPVSAEYDKTAMGTNVISGLPVVETHTIIDHQTYFHNLIKEELAKHLRQGHQGEITEMLMKDIIRKVKRRCEYERTILQQAPPLMF